MFEKERESLRRQGKWAWFLLAPVVCVGSYCVCGVGAAIAIPAFVDFARSEKAQEARSNLAALASAMESWCERAAASGAPGYPPSTPPTPAEPREERQTFVPTGSFVDLQFAPDSVYYSYSIDTPAFDRSSVIAEGDLDGDGVRSRYVVGCLVTLGTCECDDEPTVDDELE